MFRKFLAEPNWRRLGFSEAPNEKNSGKGVGIVIFDEVINHPCIGHLSGRLKRVFLDNESNIICKDVVLEETKESPPYKNYASHGMMSLFLLSHLPFEIDGEKYTGVVPAARYFIIPHLEPKKIKKVLEWLMKKKDEFNIRVVLSTIVPNTSGFIHNTKKDIFVQALMPAVEADVLVVAANGNSPAMNNYHPIEFFSVGGYDDEGSSDISKHKPHLLSGFGINGDGHFRPDILAPFTYLPVPYYDAENMDGYSPFYDKLKSYIKLSYFGGTSGAATLIAGVCAYMFSIYPYLTNERLKQALIGYSRSLNNIENPTPIVDVKAAIEAIANRYNMPKLPKYHEAIKIINPEKEILSSNGLMRAMALTILIANGKCSREMLWEYVNDESERVKKVAIFALDKPMSEEEKELYWEHFRNSKSDSKGIRQAWVYMIFKGSIKSDLHKWMKLVTDRDGDVRLCVKSFLMKFYPEAPYLEHIPDCKEEVIAKISKPILEWYVNYKLDNFYNSFHN